MSPKMLSERDIAFCLYELLDAERLTGRPRYREHNRESFDAALATAQQVAGKYFANHNRKGDENEPVFDGRTVTLIPEIKAACEAVIESGLTRASRDFEQGGMQLPHLLSQACFAWIQAANVSSSVYAFLAQSAATVIEKFGSDDQRRRFFEPMLHGRFFGTMCLTEPHAGSSLGDIRATADLQPDGTFRVRANKIFISAGEHDLSENIVHLVLAKVRGPNGTEPGVKGISLFIVPKFLVNADGSLGARNPVSCGSIEHKMGIKGSATAVLNFDGAKGWLIGEPGNGLAYMFTMMNYERLSIGIQGLGLGEVAYQSAAAYAKDRLQSRAPTGAVAKEKMADPIIVHPDVRRMLLTARAYSEAGRAFACFVGEQLDMAKYHEDDATRADADALVQLLTPVAKAFFSDKGFESCVLGQQVFGGHGYIREWGMEQLVRDARIAQIYEGTNGIQALDLAGRKVARNGGAYARVYFAQMRSALDAIGAVPAVAGEMAAARKAIQLLEETTDWLIAEAKGDANAIGAASVDYLELFGLVTYGWLWARMLAIAAPKAGADAFYTAKLATGRFYFQRLLPKADALAAQVRAGSVSLMTLDSTLF